MFKANGVDVTIMLKPLRYKTDDAEVSKVDTNDNVQGTVSKEGEVEERENNTL